MSRTAADAAGLLSSPNVCCLCNGWLNWHCDLKNLLLLLLDVLRGHMLVCCGQADRSHMSPQCLTKFQAAAAAGM